MKTNKEILKKLASYSTVAGAVIGVNTNVDAALVVYNLDPDSSLFNPQDTAIFFEINLNNTGADSDDVTDFAIIMNKFDTASYASGVGQGIAIYAYTSNRVAGTFSTYVFGASSGYTNTNFYLKAIPLSSGSSVNSTLALSDNAPQVSGGIFWNSYTNTLVWGYDSKPGSSWANFGGAVDKYIGLRFVTWGDSTVTLLQNGAGDADSLDIDGFTINDTTWATTEYYGWVLMDVGTDGYFYTVKAWAYNDVPGQPALCIGAGLQNPTGTQELPELEDVSVYAFNGTINITASTTLNDGNVRITNSSGQSVLTTSISGTSKSIDVSNLNTGI
ncbi:MAG: T9SS type A sorting domain-containing protein [Flavobacteriales bacterium]|nr:T9SS type A sorting domain-containing protein [Flavobacteriales bacterium]